MDRVEDNYELMFGKSELPQFFPIGLSMYPVFVNDRLIEETMERARAEKKWVLVFCPGTKPCFYKFWGSIEAAARAGLPYLVVNAGQHYDERLTYGKYEFNFRERTACELGIRGDLAQKSAEIMIKIRWLARFLQHRWPEVTAVPVVLGDTILTAMIPPAWMFSRGEKAIQNEAGLRSMAPAGLKDLVRLSLPDLIERQFRGSWRLLRNEPMPEQFDTFVAAAGSEFLFAPLEINKRHLVREGHPAENIHVIGGAVSDALSLKRSRRPERSVFEEYPKLRRGRWLRVDIHRRGNLIPARLRAIVSAVVRLVEEGRYVNFIEMNASRHALEAHGLKDDLLRLRDRPNFLYTEVWPRYSQVIEFFESDRCFAVLTDSGGVQEEMNLLNKPCLTCRFNTDRPETVKDARGNLLVPPLEGEFIVKMVNYLYDQPRLYQEMSEAPVLYGEGVGERFVAIIRQLMERGAKPFRWAHEAEGFALDQGRDLAPLNF